MKLKEYKCFRCCEIKPQTAFYIRRQRKPNGHISVGVQSSCKDCSAIAMKVRREKARLRKQERMGL